MGMVTGDRILETTTTVGTGDITLAGAVTGYRAFSTVATANGDQFPYVIAGPSEWEVGIGTRTGASTFSRSPTASSNAGALVTFSSGTKEVWIDWTKAFIDSTAHVQNILYNGAMEVSQQYGTAAITAANGFYKVDGQTVFINCTSGNETTQQVADAPSGLKFASNIKATTGTASPASGDYFFSMQKIETARNTSRLLFGTAGALSISCGFFVKGSRTGTYGLNIANHNGTRTYIGTWTVNAAATWEYKTLVIPGDTSGTWQSALDGSLWGQMLWAFMAGSGVSQAAGSWQTSGNIGATGQTNGAQTNDNFSITGAYMIPGSVPLTAEQAIRLMRPFDEELPVCQRYYQKSYNYATAPGTSDGLNATDFGLSGLTSNTFTVTYTVMYKVRMRAAPTITLYSQAGTSGKVRDLVAAVDVTGSTQRIGDTSFQWFATTNAASSTIELGLHWTADARL